MSVLPLFHRLKLDLLPVEVPDGKGDHADVQATVKSIFKSLKEALENRSLPDKDGKIGPSLHAAKLAGFALGKIVNEEICDLSDPGYFARVWTLSGK